MFHIRSFCDKVCLSLTEPSQTSKMRRFAKIANGYKQDFEHASILQYLTLITNTVFDYLFHFKICLGLILKPNRVNV